MQNSSYGRVRLGGTFGYALAAPLAGLVVQYFGIPAAFWGCSVMFFITLLFIFFGNRLLKRFTPYPLFILALVISGVRLILFAAANTSGQVVAIQLPGGLTFPAMWMAGVAYADQKAPPGMSTAAQGIFSAVVFGIGTAVGGFFGGILLGEVGAKELFLIFGIAVLAIVAFVLLASRFLPAQRAANQPIV
jgi:predicted MFS family arabinose efflux permease